jgi:hypothetical protein
MPLPRTGRFVRPLALGLALALTAGCTDGGSQRASDIQNLNGITDDISAVRMTDSTHRYARDPNTISTIPRNYEVRDR